MNTENFTYKLILWPGGTPNSTVWLVEYREHRGYYPLREFRTKKLSDPEAQEALRIAQQPCNECAESIGVEPYVKDTRQEGLIHKKCQADLDEIEYLCELCFRWHKLSEECPDAPLRERSQ